MPKKQREPIPTNEEIAEGARREKRLEAKVKKYQDEYQTARAWVTDAMRRAGTRLVEVGGVRVVYTQQEPVEYDEAGLHHDLTPKQRREVFDESLEISRLSAKERKALHEAMLAHMTKAQLRRATTFSLNKRKLSQAVQGGKVPLDIVNKHSTVTKRAPYTTITLK